MFWRILEPKRNHALYFPRTSKVVMGTRELVWAWSDYRFHQVELGHFVVYVEFGQAKNIEVAGSADGLLFKLKVAFRVEVVPTAPALAKATRHRFATTTDLKQTIGIKDFESHLLGKLQTVVAQALAKREYLSANATDFRRALEEEIEQLARKVLTEEEGFALLGVPKIAELMPETPGAHTLAQDDVLREKWIAYSGRLEEIQDESARVEQERRARANQRKRETEEQEAKLDAESDVRRKKIVEDSKAESAKIADAAEIENERRSRERGERSLESKKADEEIAQKRFKAEKATEIIKAQEEAKVQAENRKLEIGKLHAESERLNEELSLLGVRQQIADAQAALAEREGARLRSMGSAEAEVLRVKTLAENADVVEARKELLQALPAVLEKLQDKGARTGETRVLYVGGTGSDGTGKEAAGLAGLVSGVSSLSVLRELLQFVGEWNAPTARERQEPRSTRR